MRLNKHRLAAAGTIAALTLPLLAVAVAPADAATTITMEVGCSAVNIRSGPSTSYVALGVGYYGDLDRINAATMSNGHYTWYRGTVTRHSDGKRITGWVTATCMGWET